MEQSTVLPSITINGKEINCYEGDRIITEAGQYILASQDHEIFYEDGFIYYDYLSIPTKDAGQIDFSKLTNYEKNYVNGKLKTIKYFL